MWQQCDAQTGPGSVRVLDEGCKAAECHPSEDHKAYVDVNVEHGGDGVQDKLTQDGVQCPV